MKRLISLILAITMIFTIATGCSTSQPAAQNQNNNQAENTTENITESTAEDSIKWDKEVNLLVIGAGGAGLSAAVEAADNGTENILLIEKMPVIGGTTFISQGLIGGSNSDIAKKLEVKHTEEELYDLLMNNAHYRLDPKLARITADSSGETINWLQNNINIKFKDEIVVGYGPLQMMHMVDGGGIAMKEPFTKALEDRKVEVMLETPAKDLISDIDGNILGAIADKDGSDYYIKAKAIVIATGGYAANAELAAALNPTYEGIYGLGHPASTGDGIIMASKHGAAISNSIHMMLVFKDYDLLANKGGNTNTANISKYIAAPNVIFVGKEGKRFVDEKSGGFMNQDIAQPILDQMHKDEIPYIWAITDQHGIDKSGAVRGMKMEFLKADSIEELAKLMEVDPIALSETVVKWNEGVAEGNDDEFNRDQLDSIMTPPYYAASVVPGHIITYGGILRNEKAEVLRADGSVIPGLFTAGETSANSSYMGFTLSNCFTWGRIAGASAAEYIK